MLGGTLLPTYLANQIYDELLELESIDWHKRAVEDTKKNEGNDERSN